MFKMNLAYEASAGSGKTFNLVARYLTLLFMGASPSKILTLTFTNKAANEMSERITQSLMDMGDEIELVCKQSGLNKEEILGMQKQVLERFLSADTKIMTIDKFFTMIVRKFSLYLAMQPTFTTLSSQHEQKLLEEFLQESQKNYQYEELLDISLFMQKRVSDIFSLLRELYVKKAELGDILNTKTGFTNSYAVKAFNAFLAIKKMVLECSSASATVKNSVNAQTFEELLMKRWIYRDTLNYSTFKKCYQPLMDEYLSIVQDNVVRHMRMREQYFLSSLYALLQTFTQSKQKLAKDSLEISFDDVSVFAYELLNSRIDSDFLYFRLDAKIDHILLDEFQDTSILQYKILRPLIKEIVSGSGTHENGSFFFVGDTKQSIYRFRGGVSELFDYVCRENHITKESLSVNYRSKNKIVSFVNSVFESKIVNYVPQHSFNAEDDGYVEVVEGVELLDDLYVKVQMLIDLGANLNDIAVLCATNDDGVQIARMFEQHNIDVVTQTTSKLINQPIVQAVVQYLHYQYFKEDIYRYNFFALTHQKVQKLDFVDLQNLSLLRIVDDLIAKFHLFDGTQNLLSFLEILGKYKDVEEFLFTYMQDDTAAPASSLEGIRVLTVHKSKGLEFEHVIVIDRFKRPPASRNVVIYEYNGITLENIYLRSKGREQIDKAYDKALQKDKELAVRDKINALYVAFTRAKQNLFVLKKDENSIFEVLDLQTIKHGTLHVKHENLYAKEKETLDYKSLRYGLQTDVLSQAKEKEDDLQAIYFGLAMHYCLEMMLSFEIKAIGPAFYAMQNKYGFILNNHELEDIKSRIQMLVSSEKFLSLVRGDCFKEQGMIIGKELRYMDLLVQKNDGSFIVIDYKSSNDISLSHISQVRGYISAVKQITSKTVLGYLCYIKRDAIEIIQV